MSDALPMIVADVGNSALKLAVARRGKSGGVELVEKLDWLHDEFDAGALERWAPKGMARWRVASVHRGKSAALLEWIAAFRPGQEARMIVHGDLPLAIGVDAPEKVGIDRLLTAVAANARRAPEHAAITITAGTAVTVNAISAAGAFLGGAILPGWPLLAKSLHQYTDALPLVNDLGAEGMRAEPIGKNTHDAIRSGIDYGLQGAVERLMGEFERRLGGEAEIFLAGGEAAFLHRALGRGELAPDLVLEGAAIVALSGPPSSQAKQP